MSAALIQRLRKQRESKVVVGVHTFIVRRPTDVEMVDIDRAKLSLLEVTARFVCGWEGVTENDIVGGGGSDLVPFDIELWREWSADRPDFWQPIAAAALESYGLHQQALEAAGKK